MFGVFAAACRYALFRLVRLKLEVSASSVVGSSPLLSLLLLLDMLLLLVLLKVRLSVAELPAKLVALLLLLGSLVACTGHPRSVSTCCAITCTSSERYMLLKCSAAAAAAVTAETGTPDSCQTVVRRCEAFH
jgi:hypothetical protein